MALSLSLSVLNNNSFFASPSVLLDLRGYNTTERFIRNRNIRPSCYKLLLIIVIAVLGGEINTELHIHRGEQLSERSISL